MIPTDTLKLTDEKIQAIVDELCDEIMIAKTERASLEAKWSEAKVIYDALPKEETKNFPWENASNVVYPVGAIHSENIFSRLYGRVIRESKPLFAARPLSAEWVEHCRKIEDFLDWSCRTELNLPNVALDWFFEATKMGTGVVKLLWEREKKKKWFQEGKTSSFKLIETSRPKLYFIPIQNLIVPTNACDIQSSPWIDHVIYTTPANLKWKQASGIYKNVDKIIYFLNKKEDISAEEASRAGQDEVTPHGMDLHEIWANFDIDNDGYPEGVCFTVHLESRTWVRVAPNGYHHQEYPFHRIRFFPGVNRFYGIGICEMAKQMQAAATTGLNQWIDNTTVANTRLWKARKNAGIKTNEKIYPGKVVFLEDPDRDLKAEQMGEVYQSGVLMVNLVKAIAEQRTGVTDYQQGRESSLSGSRATATSTLALLRQSNLKTDLTLADFDLGMQGLGFQTLQLYQQYCPDGKTYKVLGTNGKYVDEIFAMPQEYIPEKVAIELSCSSMSINREIERQYYLQLIPLVNNYYGQLLKALTEAKSPQAPPGAKDFIMKLATGGTELMNRTLELFVKDPETFIPALMDMENYLSDNVPDNPPAPVQPGMEGANVANPNPGAVGPDGQPIVPPGMEGLPGPA